jgi:hypothetical protein
VEDVAVPGNVNEDIENEFEIDVSSPSILAFPFPNATHLAGSSKITLGFQFTESLSAITAGLIEITPELTRDAIQFTEGDSTLSIAVTAAENTDDYYEVKIAEGKAADTSSPANTNTEVSIVYRIDNIAPTVTFEPVETRQQSNFDFTAVFSEPVLNVECTYWNASVLTLTFP